ncbi:MAG: RibD family protein [Actinomycetota bacterium]
MTARPYVVLSCAVSVDGFIDDSASEPLRLSNDEDFDRVDDVRAGADAILVGANTIRRDDPRLLVRSEARVRDRIARGLPPQPVKVTVTTSGALDPDRRFFTAGDGLKLVYASSPVASDLREHLRNLAVVVDAGRTVDVRRMTDDLGARGVRRLMVEGGTSIHTQFLTAGLVDELHLAVCPFFVGDTDAPRFVGAGVFPWNRARRMTLAEVRPVGDVVLLRYVLGDRGERPS